MVAEASSQKSTNVRIPLVTRAQLAGLRSASHLFPALAVGWAERLFFRPHRYARPEREREYLIGAHRMTLGKQLAAWSWGTGPTVLLVHGWEGRGSQLGALVAPLVARGLRVVAFDGPAHGESPGQETNVFEFAQAICEITSALGGIHGVVAHSFGAAATTIAVKDGLTADRIVYVAPWCSLFRAADNFGAKLGLSHTTARLLQENLLRRFASRRDDFDTRNIAPLLRAPLLIVHDEDDREVSVDEGRDLHALWSGSRFAVTRGFGHRRILRATELIEPAVAFLAGSGG